MLAIIMAIEDDNDRQFVEMIFNKYAQKMYLVAMGVLHDHDDAEDCVQDTIVKIIDKLDRFKQAHQEEYLVKLIVITCRNTAINKYNKKQRSAEMQFSTTEYDEDDEATIMDIPDYSSNVEQIVLNNFVCRYVTELIDKLDHKYRDVLVLKSMGYDYEEMAYFMNISNVLVRKRYSRAKALLLEMGGDTLYEFRD